MTFLQAQMTKRCGWYVLDGDDGTTFLPDDLDTLALVDEDADGDEAEDARKRALQYYQGSTVYSVTKREGFGVRSSAPGYMDCTEWSVYATEAEAEAAYESEREENDEESED